MKILSTIRIDDWESKDWTLISVNIQYPNITDEQILADYDNEIIPISQELACGDNYLAEELRSEMYMSILTSKSNDKVINLTVAKHKAIEYLDKIMTDHRI